MDYKIKIANKNDIPKLIEYKLKSIVAYAEVLQQEEINKIEMYLKGHIPMQLKNYKIICVENNKIGCLLVENKDDCVLLDEIYIEEHYRNNAIGTSIIKELCEKNNIIYLWVYKLNIKAISLYTKLGFEILEENKNRYYMKYENKNKYKEVNE